MTDREKRFARAMGRRLQLLRGERHLTQEELGRAIGLDRSRISRYEKGRVGLNGWNVVRLAEVLGVTTDELLGVKPVRPPRVGDRLSRRLEEAERLVPPHREPLARILDSYLETHGDPEGNPP